MGENLQILFASRQAQAVTVSTPSPLATDSPAQASAGGSVATRKRARRRNRHKDKVAKKRGRPAIDLDQKLFYLLAEAGCSIDEMAAMLSRAGAHVSYRTVYNRLQDPAFAEARRQGILCGHANLRTNMVAHSKLPNSAGVRMSEFLATNWLGMVSRDVRVDQTISGSVNVTTLRERNIARVDDLAKRIESRVAGLAAAAGAGRVLAEPIGGGA